MCCQNFQIVVINPDILVCNDLNIGVMDASMNLLYIPELKLNQIGGVVIKVGKEVGQEFGIRFLFLKGFK